MIQLKTAFYGHMLAGRPQVQNKLYDVSLPFECSILIYFVFVYLWCVLRYNVYVLVKWVQNICFNFFNPVFLDFI